MQAGINPIAAIRGEPNLRQAWLEGTPVDSCSARSDAIKIFSALERMTHDISLAPA